MVCWILTPVDGPQLSHFNWVYTHDILLLHFHRIWRKFLRRSSSMGFLLVWIRSFCLHIMWFYGWNVSYKNWGWLSTWSGFRSWMWCFNINNYYCLHQLLSFETQLHRCINLPHNNATLFHYRKLETISPKHIHYVFWWFRRIWKNLQYYIVTTCGWIYAQQIYGWSCK